MSETQRVETQDPDSIGACNLSAPGVGANALEMCLPFTRQPTAVKSVGQERSFCPQGAEVVWCRSANVAKPGRRHGVTMNHSK